MISATLQKILVTVTLVGQPPMQELLPREYPTTNSSCKDAAEALMPHLKAKGRTVRLECVDALTRGS